MEMLYKLVTS